jgi:hypothetical protein
LTAVKLNSMVATKHTLLIQNKELEIINFKHFKQTKQWQLK